MKKQFIFTFKLAITAIIVGVVYFMYFVPSLSVLFDFDFMSKNAWYEKWAMQFASGNWVIKTLSDVLLLFMMVMWIPLYFLFVWLFMKIKWRAFRIKPKPKTVVRKALDLKKDKQVYAKPRAMPSTIQATKYVAPRLPGQEDAPEKKASNKSHKNVLQMIKQMAVVARKFKVEIFQHIVLEGYKVPMAVSTAARAIMIEIVNRNDVNWSVDFNEDIMQSNWYSEGGVMERMAEDLINASAALEKAEPGSEVIKVICVTDGRVLNAKPTVDYFKEHDIHLLVFNNGLPKTEILDFSSFLSAHFELKEGEIDPALVKLPKVPLKSEQTSNNNSSEDEDEFEDADLENQEDEDENVPSFEDEVFEDIETDPSSEDETYDFVDLDAEEELVDLDYEEDKDITEPDDDETDDDSETDAEGDIDFGDDETDDETDEEIDTETDEEETQFSVERGKEMPENVSQKRGQSNEEFAKETQNRTQNSAQGNPSGEDGSLQASDPDETDDFDTDDEESVDDELFEQRLKSNDSTDDEDEFVTAVARG